MRRTHLLASIGGALALGLLTASAQAAPGQFGAVAKSVPTQNSLLTLMGGGHGGGGHGGGGHGGGGHGGGGHSGGAHGGGGGHMGGGHGGHFGGRHFGGGHFGGGHGGHFAGGHFRGHRHDHFHGFGGWPYYYSNCWWSPRYQRWVCPWY